jgi:hypothetical protein
MNSIKIHFVSGNPATITAEMLPMQAIIIAGPSGNVLEIKNATGEMVAEILLNSNVLWVESDLQTATND